MSEGQQSGKGNATDELFRQIRWYQDGLIPAIVQDEAGKEVLMLAYMNEQALQKTLETREAWFYSRSRQELWHKGATSGNILHVRSLAYDCDADTLLLKVIPSGPACHTGEYSCFYRQVPLGGGTDGETGGQAVSGHSRSGSASDRFAILGELEALIAKREAERPEGSYTTYLFETGLDKILKKIGEETAEVIIAAKNQSREELRYETSDLIYHLLVLLRQARLPLDEVMQELERRHR